MHPLIACLVLALGSGSAQDRAPEPIIKLMDSFRAAGLLIGYPTGMHGGTTSRYENAVQVYVVVQNTESLVLAVSKDGLKERESLEVLALFQGRWRELDRAVVEFHRELDSLGANTASMRATIGSFEPRIADLWFKAYGKERLYPAFRDVPAGHWARESVSYLKTVGVLKGYPDGTYRG